MYLIPLWIYMDYLTSHVYVTLFCVFSNLLLENKVQVLWYILFTPVWYIIIFYRWRIRVALFREDKEEMI